MIVASMQQGPSTQEGAEDAGFHASTGGAEMQSGERLLVEAYAAIWLIVLVFVFVMWRRTRDLEDRIEALSDAIKASKSGVAKSSSKKSSDAREAAEPASEAD